MRKILTIDSKFNSYDVEFADSISEIVELTKANNTITIIDENIANLYQELSDSSFIRINCIEDNKNLIGTELILDELVNRKANISTKLIVIGGGIIQDLAGYCASIYCRGIDYVLVPTTLLSQVDSCIGGKTSLNYKQKKNILGTFYPPSKILIYSGFLKTLSNLDYYSGWGEIYKFQILQNRIFEFIEVESAIYDGLKFKSEILKLDEFDKKERKYLNFGHTFGHALESISQYQIPHGIAVVIGSMIALNVSKSKGYYIENYDAYINTGCDLLKMSKIKLNKEWFNFETLLPIIQSDKKNTGIINMILYDSGPKIEPIHDLEVLKQALIETYESIRLHN
jgi:3-dehydroquinate synthase